MAPSVRTHRQRRKPPKRDREKRIIIGVQTNGRRLIALDQAKSPMALSLSPPYNMHCVDLTIIIIISGLLVDYMIDFLPSIPSDWLVCFL